MSITKKKLCIFLHYFPESYFPIYIQYYLNELYLYFDEVIMVTNKRKIESTPEILNNGIFIQYVKNEGYDLGMFYKAIQTIDFSQYSEIACINDSNALINSLNSIFAWGRNQKLDFWGIIDSYEKPWFSNHENNYHIQSHFIVFNERAIPEVVSYIENMNIQAFFDEKNKKTLRKAIINDWEIGLSRNLINKGLTCGAYIDSLLFLPKYISQKPVNVGFKFYDALVKAGFPLIKKKIIFRKCWRNRFHLRSNWEKLIRRYGNEDWKMNDMILELKSIKNDYQKSQK